MEQRVSRTSWLGSISPDSDNDDLPNFDQIVQLMEAVNGMVKAAQFTPALANAIFALCAQLKLHGPTLEQTHKTELNKVFVSLRQACCRDHGQLGTPCRLKIMELVELRAMHWRSNLAHSQYYVNRPEQLAEDASQHAPSMGMNFQAPPFTPQFLMPDSQPTHPTMPGGFVNPLLPGLLQQPLFASALGPSAADLLLRKQQQQQQQLKKSMAPKPLQLRHEMIIRNVDSGKIMGVKGRRVALVEQITNTVISFQKVDPKAKERTLTITASTMDAIEHAKQLVEDTIRRNTSPVRPEAAALFGLGVSTTTSHSEAITASSNAPPPAPTTVADDAADDDSSDEEESGANQDIQIETTQDGVLKLCCSDPEVLQAAQEALNEYLRMRTRPSNEEREKKKERRKSMPLQTAVKEEKVEERRSGLERARSLGGSTPNLQEQAEKAASRLKPFGPCYGREALLAQATADNESVEAVQKVLAQVKLTAPEVLRSE